MAGIKLTGITFDDLDEILFRSDEEPDQTEIDEEAWSDIVSEFEGVTA